MAFKRYIKTTLALCGTAWLAGCAIPTEQTSMTGTTTANVPDQSSRCLSDREIAQWAEQFAARRPLSNPPSKMSFEDAACTRGKFQQQLVRLEGPVIGYKVALSNKGLQENFKITEPIWGTYHAAMHWPDKSNVSVRYGAQPVYKAGLLVRVKSGAINQAQTAEDVFKNIDQIIPYIELMDIFAEKPSALNARTITALNASARMGITGRPLRIPGDARRSRRLFNDLKTMNIHVIGDRGITLAQGKGSDVAEHPLNVVVWLADTLKKQGKELKPGQVIGLGAFSPLLRPKSGDNIVVAYPGLTGARSVSVSFVE